ncbi:T9SS type A sorting domain-containing protein [Hymenobacter terrenus]|uniref:T9SS type A sorting domain-containing protein n=1 Tax=Hymenobacter terrenus TaxID=1629124 RepID=UPI0006194486|nr:T9SS type A sorting domain-containing protein [Hymenobacter terrenus]
MKKLLVVLFFATSLGQNLVGQTLTGLDYAQLYTAHDVFLQKEATFVVGAKQGTISLSKYTPKGLVWETKQAVGEQAQALAVSADASGNSYIAGYFSGTLSFGAQRLTTSGQSDVFLAKYDPAGHLLWVKALGGSGQDMASDIAVDAQGNSYLTGSFESEIVVGNTTLVSNGSQDIFIAKYNAAGVVEWIKATGGTGRDRGQGITLDKDGQVVVTGSFEAYALFDAIPLSLVDNQGLFLAKYNGAGEVQWAQLAGGIGAESQAVTTDSKGDILVTGSFVNTASFGPFHLTAQASKDVFITKYSQAGQALWAQQASGELSSKAIYTVGTQLYVLGSFMGSAAFTNVVLNPLRGESANIFLANYLPEGKLNWAKRLLDAPLAGSPLAGREKYSLMASPNPATVASTIRFSVKTTEQVTLEIYNSNGHKIANLYNGIAQAGQVIEVPLNATQLKEGNYIVRLTTQRNTEFIRVMLN